MLGFHPNLPRLKQFKKISAIDASRSGQTEYPFNQDDSGSDHDERNHESAIGHLHQFIDHFRPPNLPSAYY